MCPHCGSPLVGYEFKGVEIDHCPNCGGTWLDAGELDMLLELEASPGGKLNEAMLGNLPARVDLRRCPRCTRRMGQIGIPGDPPVQVDRCSFGHGLWFDRGELKAAIAAFEGGEAAAVSNYFSELFRYELQHNGG